MEHKKKKGIVVGTLALVGSLIGYAAFRKWKNRCTIEVDSNG